MIGPIAGANLINIFRKIRFRAIEFSLYVTDHFTFYKTNENKLLPCNTHTTKMC